MGVEEGVRSMLGLSTSGATALCAAGAKLEACWEAGMSLGGTTPWKAGGVGMDIVYKILRVERNAVQCLVLSRDVMREGPETEH